MLGKRRDGSTKWQARVWDKHDPTVRYERQFRLKDDANAWLVSQLNAMNTGTHIASPHGIAGNRQCRLHGKVRGTLIRQRGRCVPEVFRSEKSLR